MLGEQGSRSHRSMSYSISSAVGGALEGKEPTPAQNKNSILHDAKIHNAKTPRHHQLMYSMLGGHVAK
jgi:hypothetical protein